MAAGGFYISRKDWDDFADLMRAWRRGELIVRPVAEEDRRPSRSAPRVVILHGTLEPGRRVKGELLRRAEDDEVVYDLELVGWPPPNPEFDLPVGATTLRVSALHTAAELLKSLRTTPEGKKFVIGVSLGRHKDAPPGVTPLRWRVQLRRVPGVTDALPNPVFALSYGNAAGYLTQVNVWPVPWVGTGELIDVSSALPVGDPSPIRLGAQCIVQRVAGEWCVTAGEMRRLSAGFPGWLL